MLEMKQNDFHRLAQIVRDETGNKVLEKNYPMLEARLRTHIQKLGFADITQYWQHFGENEKIERENLKSLMTTHYTFFFREFIHFEILEKWIESEISRLKERFKTTNEPVRVWSAACSRGQEVYSLAMFLESALLKKHGIPYEIVGSDIDQNSINIANNGVYPLQEVNTIPHLYLTEYWRRGTGHIKNFAAIRPSLKAKTQYQVLNLLDLKSFNKTFDVIFCRNVFIYFADEDVKKIALSLSERLRPGGFLASGISEPLRFPGWNLKSVGASVYKKVIETENIAKKEVALPLAVVSPVVNTYRVLCVDDSPVIQKLIEKIYKADPLCAEIGFASNGQEARKMLDSKKYDLVTLDIHMPICGGIEFLENLYDRKKDPPIIMVSSVNRTDIDLATKSISLGAFDYIEKPAMNKIAQSSAEFLTKTQLALKSAKMDLSTIKNTFDQSIGQKILVPDASQCVRIVTVDDQMLSQLEAIIKSQKYEYRSPALVIVYDNFKAIENSILHYSQLPITHFRGGKLELRPSTIFLIHKSEMLNLVDAIADKSVSLQIVGECGLDFSVFKKCRRLQLLIEESILIKMRNIEHTFGLKISDVTPATSFASLSLEYFAKVRKAAA